MKRVTRGFTLLEALVALLVVVSGALALIRLQLDAELANERTQQRSEAMRLAEQRIEALRARVPWVPPEPDDPPDTGTEQVGGFTRRWSLSTPEGTTFRLVRIGLDWNTRFGRPLTLDLTAIVGSPDVAWTARPEDTSTTSPPLSTIPTIRQLATRPWGDSRQRLVLNEHLALVFDTLASDPPLLCPLASVGDSPAWTHCSVFRGLLLSGYITRHASAAHLPWPSGVDTSGVTGLNPDGQFTCRLADGSGHKAYLCVVTGVGSAGWSGTVRLTGLDAQGGQAVCRFEHAAGPNLMDDNQRHVQPYQAVRQSLMHQNHLLFADPSDTGACPGDIPLPPGVRLMPHQSCGATSADGLAACP